MLGDVLATRLAAQRSSQRALRRVDLTDLLHLRVGNANHVRLFGKRLKNRLANPPDRVANEFGVLARVEAMRGFDQAGFCFYTNLTSAKGNDLDANPRAALGFHWQPLARQVRIWPNGVLRICGIGSAWLRSSRTSVESTVTP